MQCYTAATIFVVHYSHCHNVHLMKRITLDETVQAKQEFEWFADAHGVKIKHYHCNSGRFSDNTFKAHAEQMRHTSLTVS